jgi:tetratricopeptide (TPR) repeat protein
MKNIILTLTLILSSNAFCQSAEGARSKFSDGDLPGTIALLDKAIELETIPMNLRSNYLGRADLKFKIKDYFGAIADYTKAETLGVTDNSLYINRANAKNELNDYRGAIKDYDRYLSKNILNIDLAAAGGSNISEDEKKRIGKKYSSIYFRRGNAKFNLRDFTGAKLDYNITINLDPADASAYCNRGLVEIGLGQHDSACLDFSRAGELGFQQSYELIKKYCK